MIEEEIGAEIQSVPHSVRWITENRLIHDPGFIRGEGD